MKTYILVKESVPVGLAINSAYHASLKMWFRFHASLESEKWILGRFDNVTCKVSDEEFERAKEFEDYSIVTESALDDKEVILAFAPREEWPKFFKFLKLYK